MNSFEETVIPIHAFMCGGFETVQQADRLASCLRDLVTVVKDSGVNIYERVPFHVERHQQGYMVRGRMGFYPATKGQKGETIKVSAHSVRVIV